MGHHSLAQQLAHYMAAGTPLPSALRGVSGGLGDRNLARAVDRLAAACQRGAPLADAMDRSLHFERVLASFVRWGERRSTLPDALAEASDLYRQQIGLQLTFVRRVIPPCLVLLVGGGAFLVVVGLLLPLVKLIEGLT